MNRSVAVWAALTFFSLASTSGQTLISRSAKWQFRKGTNEASSPVSAWRARSFDSSSWTNQPAPFAYGEPAFEGGTPLNDMQGGYTTLFLRREFTVADVSNLAALTLNAVCDDGFIAWINGTQVAALGPPTGDVVFNAVAGANVAEPIAFTPYECPIPLTYLAKGNNVIAVQVFNQDIGSSDLVFDAELVATPTTAPPLSITSVSPPPGIVNALTQATVTFSEPVTGVRAEDFLLNGLLPTAVTGAGATYTFSFPQPAYGAVVVSWSVFHNIQSSAAPIRRFDSSTPGSTWNYELVDASGPKLAQIHPPAELTVGVLRQVEIFFDRPVLGVDAPDLLVNSQPATSVEGIGAGPYLFSFTEPPAGVVIVSWANGHGITDDTAQQHGFSGGSWRYVRDPEVKLPDLFINEILAENFTGLKDEEGDVEPWIELLNRSSAPVNLLGWSLTDDEDEPGKWTFPSVNIPAGGFLVVFASGNDRRAPVGSARFHTNFKLSPNGEYLGLHSPELPRRVVSELSPSYPEQGPDHSYGRDPFNRWRYYRPPTPGAPNGFGTITGKVDEVHFSVERGYFTGPFNLSLACPTPDARIVYTTNGSAPTETNGVVYTAPIPVTATRIIRAAAFKTNHLPSRLRTHTYLFNIALSRTYFPALSLVTASNNLYGATGIMEYNPRNTMNHGIAWERPVSAELIRVDGGEGFQVDCGIRVAGGDYIRSFYNYRSGNLPESKYSFRLYFRGDYGTGRLRYPWFPDTTLDEFDSVQLRAGMNDPTNPFIKDEFVRLLGSDIGIAACHGTFVHLFLNGLYKGYYNPCERVDNDFLRAYHGGGEKWDVIAQMNTVREGDMTAFNALRTVARKDLKVPVNYLDVASRLDLVNFIDYLCTMVYVDNDDWPHNNWRAARERVPGAKFRFYTWDAEWAFGHTPSWNTIANQLSTLSPPWGTTEIQQLFNSLKVAPEFKLLFADRVHKHFFNGGALTDERLKVRYAEIKTRVVRSISGFDDRIGSVWIPQRRRYLTNHFASSGFIASSNAPVFSQLGGRIPAGYALSMKTTAGTVWFTTNGVDPRVMFTSEVHSNAVAATVPLTLAVDTLVKARTLLGTNWSALTEASFHVAQLGVPLRITEIMYRPPGGEEYEFLEIQNVGGVAVALDAMTVSGIDFRFPVGTAPIGAGQRIVLASAVDPAKFATRYPGVKVAGYFKGSLSNNGERIALLDSTGRLITSVTYDNNEGWPIRADGTGASLEIVAATGDAEDPANWQASTTSGGSPGSANSPASAAPTVRLNEIYASGDGTAEHPDWIEIHNSGSVDANTSGWSVTDDGNPRKFVFPPGTVVPANGFVRVWCDALITPAGLHTGFGLRSEDETIQLFDTVSMLVDVVRFGPQAAGYTLGRAGSGAAWRLCDPTPEAPNEPAAVGDASTLVINEVLANPPAGSDDWIELHNTNATMPVPLQGIYLGTSNALFQVRSLSFVAPGGFVKLIADENSGPNHIGFKLLARGDAITLLDPAGAQLDRVTFTAQAEGASYGRLPDGSGSFVAFQFTASPGASNYITFLPAVRLTEFMARNSGAVHDSFGKTPDWIELQSAVTTNLDLSGWTLSVGRREPGEWVFPSGVILEPGAFLRIWCDDDQPASTLNSANLNTGSSLSGDGGGIHVFDPLERLVNFVQYGFQLENQSVGWDGSSWSLLSAPTPGASNAPAALLGDASRVRLNEWLADPLKGDDWLELYNPESLPVNLHQHYLTDNPSVYGITNFTVGPLTFVPPRGFVLWRADGNIESGREHTPFNLDALGETVRLYSPLRALIDSADLLVQEPGVSEGRLPDGSTNRVRFAATSSPRASNWLPIEGVIVSEVLTHTDPPFEDAIELHNPTDQAVVLSGGWLSNDELDLKKFQVPDETVLAARGFKVFYQNAFDVDPLRRFTLNSAHGDAVFFSAVDGEGNLTGYRAQARFGAAENGVSFGFYPTSVGADFTALARRTFGADQPASLAQFRAGTGLPNTGAKVGPVVINEIMYRPLTIAGTNVTEDAGHEFIELHNVTGAEVPLYDPAHPVNAWKLQGGVDYVFRRDAKLPPRSFMLVVGFDPETNSTALADFKARYPSATSVPIVGPFNGRLSNEGESVELYKPDRPQQPPASDAGFVPFILVDRVNYSAEPPWPAATNSPNDSLQRMAPMLYGNEPLAWTGQSATAGAGNGNFANTDTDADGMPDVWELTYGLNPRSTTDAASDADGDGVSNRNEFIAGTDPRGGAVAFAIVSVTRLGEEVVIKLERTAGRTYTVLYTDALMTPWMKLEDVSALSAGSDVYSVVDRSAAGAARFYRIVTPAQP